MSDETIRGDLAALLVDREEQARFDDVLEAEFERVAADFPDYFERSERAEFILRLRCEDGTVIELDANSVYLDLRNKLVRIAKITYEGGHTAAFDLRNDIKAVLS